MALRKLADDLKVQQSPEPCLRQKYNIKFESELTLFQSLEMGDVLARRRLAFRLHVPVQEQEATNT